MILPKISKSQNFECGTDVLPGTMQILMDEQPAIQAFAAARASQVQTMQDVPIRFTTIQGSGGGFGFGQSDVNFALNRLNNAYSPAGIHFIQCGAINEIYDDRLKASEEIDQFIASFAYTSGAVEVYLKQSIVNPYAPLPYQAYQAGNPNWQPGYYEHTNFIKMNGFLGAGFLHEMGHHFGLLHTFFNASTTYHVPTPNENPNDYPYQVLDLSGQISPSWWGRELVIRTPLLPNDPRPF